MLIIWCRIDICSCKFSAKVSLMLDNPFPVPPLCKLNDISLCFFQISIKSPVNCLFLSGKTMFSWSHPLCFGSLGKFQNNIKISIKTARVFRLSVSCEYDELYSMVKFREKTTRNRGKGQTKWDKIFIINFVRLAQITFSLIFCGKMLQKHWISSWKIC